MSRNLVLVWLMALPLACFRPSDDGLADEIGDSSDSDTTTDTTTETDTTTDTETTTDDTETDTTTGPPPDSDSDGIDDEADNCPDDPNPNQLDFDDDGEGNVCDVMEYTSFGGSLVSQIEADAGFAGMCTIPIDLVPTGGSILVQLDDEAQLVRLELTELQVEDILDKQCNLFITATMSIREFMMVNGGGPLPVAFAHDPASHDAGTAMGLTNLPHPIVMTGMLDVSANGDPPQTSMLDLMDANFPPMTVDISGAGSAMNLTWANDSFVIATGQIMVEMPIMITVDLQIVGLDGTLMLAP